MENPDDLIWDYHLHNIILSGMSVEGENSCYSDLKDPRLIRFKRFNFRFGGHRYDTFQTSVGKTPYCLRDNCLFYQHEPLDYLPFERLNGEDDSWGSDRNWYFKKLKAQPMFHELRLNPVNFCANTRYKTGKNQEFRGCAFCHRCYPYMRASARMKVVKPEIIFAEIFSRHGTDILKSVQKVLVITGDTNTATQMLKLVEDIYSRYLAPNGFRGTFSLATSMLRTEEDIKRLAALDNTLFEFPVECFSRREELLGEKKGIPLSEIAGIFGMAKKYFKSIRINYVVGLDDLKAAIDGFRFLCSHQLIDDIVPNIFVPFTPQMLGLRHPEAHSMCYLYAFRELLTTVGLSPKRTGITKNLFSDFRRSSTSDELCTPNLEGLVARPGNGPLEPQSKSAALSPHAPIV